MRTTAAVLEKPESLELRELPLAEPTADEIVVDVSWSGISTGTERLLYTGRMPTFPGMGYPLVPGYESVGFVSRAGADATVREGDMVFVPGALCFGEIRSLFGGTASRLVVQGSRVVQLDPGLQERGVLLALAATAQHAIAGGGAPELIVGHGVLGRLLARLTVAHGNPAPTVWELNETRQGGAVGYSVVTPEADTRRDYRSIFDVSGDAGLLNDLISRLSAGGEVVLAGFYSAPLSFDFAPAFMREARIRASAEWRAEDLSTVKRLVESGALSLDGLITHSRDASVAGDAYDVAFGDPGCLKMILDWRASA
jgi:3-hydroxyethyl bacteriochlorophyllide a dehydrogenase